MLHYINSCRLTREARALLSMNEEEGNSLKRIIIVWHLIIGIIGRFFGANFKKYNLDHFINAWFQRPFRSPQNVVAVSYRIKLPSA